MEVHTWSHLAKGRCSVYISQDGCMGLETLPLELSGKVLFELSDALTAGQEGSIAGALFSVGTEPGKLSPERNNACPP